MKQVPALQVNYEFSGLLFYFEIIELTIDYWSNLRVGGGVGGGHSHQCWVTSLLTLLWTKGYFGRFNMEHGIHKKGLLPNIVFKCHPHPNPLGLDYMIILQFQLRFWDEGIAKLARFILAI